MQKSKATKNKGQPIASTSGVKLPKLPKMQKPEEYKIRTRPMFSLAEEVLKLPKPIPRAEKERLAKQQEIAPRRRRSSVLESFTAMRKSREEFRQKLMKLILQSKPGEDGDSIPSGVERNILRYYYYLRYGIDSTHVAPLDPEIIKRVQALISRKLKHWTETLEKATEEMREDFMMSMKTAIVDFVLRDPNTEESPIVEQTQVQIELGEMKDDAWRNQYVVATKFLQKNLYLYNPCIAQVLKIWWDQFINKRLIKISDLCQSSMPFDLVGFNAICNSLVLDSGQDLLTEWIPAVLEVFQQGIKRRQLPDPKNVQKVKHFYNCLAAIMTYQLQTLCNKSMIEFTDYVLDVGGKNRGFNVNVTYQNEAIEFEPTFKAFKTKIGVVLEFMIDACKKCPRIETLLYKDLIITSRATLRPLVEMSLLDNLTRKIRDMIDEQRIGPELRIQDFDDYICLLNGTSQKQVDAFLNAEPPGSFEEFCEEAVKYVEWSKEIGEKLEPTIP